MRVIHHFARVAALAAPLTLLALVAPPSLSAQETADCETQVDLVERAVAARLEGVRAGKLKRELRKDYGRTAADMLVDFVYAVPDAQVEQIAPAYKAQCEKM